MLRRVLCGAVVLVMANSAAWGQLEGHPGLAPSYDTPVLTVGQEKFGLRRLYGITVAEYDAAFQRKVGAWKDDEIIRELRFYYPGATFDAVGRDEALEMLRDGYMQSQLQQAASVIVLARIAKRIAVEHGIELEDYFDFKAMRGRLAAELQFVEHVAREREDDLAVEDVQRAAVQMLGHKLSEHKAREWANGPPWRLDMLSNRRLYRVLKDDHEIFPALMCAHYLLRETCSKGTYYAMGAKDLQRDIAHLRRLTIENYEGDGAALGSVVQQIVTEDGSLAVAGAVALQEILSKADPTIQSRLETVPGFQTTDVGVLLQPGAAHYVLCTWAATPGIAGEALEPFARGRAWKLAYERFAPVVEMDSSPELGSSADFAVSLLQHWTHIMLPDNPAADKYVLKPYPDDNFAEMERHRSIIHTYAARIASAVVAKNKDILEALADELRTKVAEASSIPVKNKYQALINIVKEQ